MPIYKYGNMFDHINEYDMFLVTTNSYIKSTGSLAMGRGAAHRLKKIIPDSPHIFGKMITSISGHLGEYNLVYYCSTQGCKYIGALQVKYHYKDKADLLLIQRSLEILNELASLWKDKKICINYPGIGYGGLSKTLVESFVDLLPHNVDVWRHDETIQQTFTQILLWSS